MLALVLLHDPRVGSSPLELISAAADVISSWTGEPVTRLTGDHEIYLSDPTVLADLVDSILART